MLLLQHAHQQLSGMTLDLEIQPIASWHTFDARPLVISGPCSVENEAQVLQTAQALATDGRITMLRGGIWKPRTRPNAFEGIGAEGLPWLKSAGEATGLPVATEVARGEHVEAALKAGIDVLWMGARTTVNPFSVQEIADALKGIDVPVFIKNPISPDLALWIGALERVNRAGITRLAAVHRGFATFQKTTYRNAPMWEIPIELKTLCPELDVVCDPSHIAGQRGLLQKVAQRAIDLDMTGLMIEAHIDPDNALSDAKQQVTPVGLSKLLNDLTVRTAQSANPEFHNQLEELRAAIDELDDELLKKLAARMDIAEQIGHYKRENQVTILQIKRWEEIIRNRMSKGEALGLSDDFLNKILQAIHKESILRQTAVMNSETVS